MALCHARLFVFSVLSLIVLGIGGCAKQSNEYESAPAVRAANLVGDSFGSQSFEGAPTITIQKNALDKEFLLHGALIEQGTASMGNAIKSRIVVFTRYGDRLYLLEASQGHVVTTDLPTQLVLASFPILSETTEFINFDFNAGMTNIFMQGDWYASDLQGKEYEANFTTARTKNSRLISVKVNEKNQLAIRQIAQLALTGGFSTGENNASVEVRYYLSPYRPDPSYTPVNGGRFIRHGFFEVSPKIESNGIPAVKATRRHLDQPVVYAISANTPKEFKQAVVDGVLYWNRAMGREVVKVIDAPTGVTAPDPDYNIVQWVPYDMAGFAFADAQMDPRTGQILHSQVFLTSAFAFIGKIKAKMLLKQLEDQAAHPRKKEMIGLQGLTANKLCQFDMNKALMKGLSELVTSDASDTEILKVAQDYVRTVTAHEIGHTLGLRHNFAGSLHVENYNLKDRSKIFGDYLKEDHVHEDVVPSSTVMDYLELEEDTLVGYRIRKQLPALQYDSKALANLYDGKKFKYGEIPLFCTDSDVEKFADCKRHDSGKSLVEYATYITPLTMKRLPYELLRSFANAKAPFEGMDAIPVEEVGFEPEKVAEKILGPRQMLVSSFAGSTRLLSVFRSFPYVGEANLDLVKEKERDFIIKEMQAADGLDHVLSTIPANFSKNLVETFERLLADPNFTSGEGLAGQKYEFTPDELVAMKSAVNLLASKLPASIAKADLALLGNLPSDWKVTNTELGDGLANLMGERVKEYVFTNTGEKLVVNLELPYDEKASKEKEGHADEEPVTKKRVTASLSKFVYSLDDRKAAAQLLKSPTNSESIDWGVRERALYKKEFTEKLNAMIGCPDDKGCQFAKLKIEEVKVIQPNGIPEPEARRIQKEATRWFVENKAVLDEFK